MEQFLRRGLTEERQDCNTSQQWCPFQLFHLAKNNSILAFTKAASLSQTFFPDFQAIPGPSGHSWLKKEASRPGPTAKSHNTLTLGRAE